MLRSPVDAEIELVCVDGCWKDEVERRAPIGLEGEDLARLIRSLEEEMHEAAKDLRLEYAARLRDEVNELKPELREVAEAG